MQEYYKLKHVREEEETVLKFPAEGLKEDIEKVVLFLESLTYNRSSILHAMQEVALELSKIKD